MSNTTSKIFTVVAAALLLSILSASSFAQTDARLYPNPTEAENKKYRNNPCSDPWISRAWIDITSGIELAPGFGGAGACDAKLYNGGTWNSYYQLVQAMQQVRNDLRNEQVKFFAFKVKGNSNIVAGVALQDINQKNAVLGGALVGNDGASIAATPEQLVAAGGGNLVAAGGGNISTSPGASYRLAAGVKRIIKVGKSVIIIK